MNDISESLKGLALASAAAVQIGEVKAFAGGAVPSKWKLCDGSVISRATYAGLFGAIGTAYGGGDGSTTFAIPDLRGRTAIGADPNNQSTASGHTAHALGQTAGKETHALTTSEMPSHSHSYTDVRFVYNGSTGGGANRVNDVFSNSTGGAGGNATHSLMQPYTAINYIIYTGVAS